MEDFKIITNDNIVSLNITPKVCVDWAHEAFRNKKDFLLKPKISLSVKEGEFFNTMPCLFPQKNLFGVKVISRIKNTRPHLKSKIFLFDTNTGKMTAILDGDRITSMRTGAVAALAIRIFMKKSAEVFAIIGLGDIARSVMRCLLSILPQDKRFTFKLLRYKNQAEEFAEEFSSSKNIEFIMMDNINEWTTDSDVIISCITYAADLIQPKEELFKKGVLVVPVHTRGFQNCDLSFDKVFGDDTGHISGFKYFEKFKSFSEISEVISGKTAGRETDDERIISYNIGIALHDIFFADKIAAIYEKEAELNER